MNRISLGAAALALGLMAAPANAADFPRNNSPYVAAPYGYGWGGFYIGLNLGYQWGNAVTVKEDHSLYWIPVQYWSAIVAVAGVILVFKVK